MLANEGFDPAQPSPVEETESAYQYPRLCRNSSQVSVGKSSQYGGHRMQEEALPGRYSLKRSASPMRSEHLVSAGQQAPGPIWEEQVAETPADPRTHHFGLVYPLLQPSTTPGSEFIDFNGIPFAKIWWHLVQSKHVNVCGSMYLSQHRDINEDMRDIVIDWLVDVHRKFKMKMETLFQALSLMDRYLERNEIKKEIFQLVATTCLFIASKFEEIYPPVLEDFVYICADTYTKNEIIHMEALILNDMGFRLVTSTSHTLLGIYATQSKI